MKPIMNDMIGTIYALAFTMNSTHLGVAGRVDLLQSLMVRYLLLILKQVVSSRKRFVILNASNMHDAIVGRNGLLITQLITFIAVDNSSPLIYVKQKIGLTQWMS